MSFDIYSDIITLHTIHTANRISQKEILFASRSFCILVFSPRRKIVIISSFPFLFDDKIMMVMFIILRLWVFYINPYLCLQNIFVRMKQTEKMKNEETLVDTYLYFGKHKSRKKFIIRFIIRGKG